MKNFILTIIFILGLTSISIGQDKIRHDTITGGGDTLILELYGYDPIHRGDIYEFTYIEIFRLNGSSVSQTTIRNVNVSDTLTHNGNPQPFSWWYPYAYTKDTTNAIILKSIVHQQIE